MKKRLLTMLLVVLMVFGSMFAFAACKNDNTDDKHTSHPDANEDGYCDIGGEKLPDDGGKDDEEYSAPVITVTPAEMELTKGTSEDEYSLLFGVTVTDEYDQDLKATVKDDGGFDIDTIGDYTVTYSATNSKGKEGTGTRVYHVVAPLPNIVVEVQNKADFSADLANPGQWSWKNEQFYEISEDTTYDTNTPGVFHNTSTSEITLTIAGGHGEAAILNSAGVVVEGRDGTNGRLVDVNHPIRANSPQNAKLTNAEGEEVELATNFASWMKIPAGGFAIVLYSSSATYNQDGGKLMAERVLHQYGAAVKIYFEDAPETLLTVYENQAPVVLSADNVIVRQDDGTDTTAAEAMLLEDLSYVDDNGTWDIADDVKTELEVEIVSRPTTAYDNATLGTYTYKLSITDGTKTTEFERSIVVREVDPVMPTISIGGKWFEFAEEKVGVNPKTVAGVKTYDVIIYTSYFTGEMFVNNWGYYTVVDANGKVREVFNPATTKKYTLNAENAVQEEAGTNTNVLSQVTLAQGEYVILAVNGAEGTYRSDALAYFGKSATKTLGETVELYLLSVFPTITVSEEGKADKVVSSANVYINTKPSSATEAIKAPFLIYTTDYQGEIVSGGSGVAVVINAQGKIVKIFDGANGHFYNETYYWAATGPAGGDRIGMADSKLDQKYQFAQATYAQVAFSSLEEGEILMIFPHNGSLTPNPRQFGLDIRQDFKKYTVTFSNFEIAVGSEEEEEPTDELQIKIGSATLTVETAAVNDESAKAVAGGVLIYTKSYTGALLAAGYGVAIVVGADNKVIASYDGTSGKLFDADHPSGDATCTPGSYISEAFAATPTGGYIIVFPNVGGENVVRAWALTNARGGALGATVELVNITLA